MSGTKMGSIKSKLGLKGKTLPGQMITRLNELKLNALKESESKASKVDVKETIKKII